jgi:ferric-dicitrate binding protein FerR (iron transport regulator)
MRIEGTLNVDVNIQRGRVALECSPTPEERAGCASELEAGDRAEFRSGRLEVIRVERQLIAPPSDETAEKSTAPEWITLNGRTLEEVVATVNQFSDRQVRIVDPSFAGYRLGGRLRLQAGHVEGLLAALVHFGIRSDEHSQEIDLRGVP